MNSPTDSPPHKADTGKRYTVRKIEKPATPAMLRVQMTYRCTVCTWSYVVDNQVRLDQPGWTAGFNSSQPAAHHHITQHMQMHQAAARPVASSNTWVGPPNQVAMVIPYLSVEVNPA